MDSLADGLSLDFRPTFVPKTISDFLKEISTIGNVSEKVSRLDEFVKGLEEEMTKIDAFKRELPLCVLLLNDVILALKEETRQCMERRRRPVLEEFIPLKKRNREKEEEETEEDNTEPIEREKEIRDKKNWMSSVQLWNADNYASDRVNRRLLDPKQKYNTENERNEEENCRDRSRLRAFVPIKGHSGFPLRNNHKEEREEISSVQGLSLLTPALRNPTEISGSSFTAVSRGISSSAPISQPNFRSVPLPTPAQTSRKQRRCWSPDLHSRFLNALQHLGGSEVATPKQIKELMQVEGLTNDEVKSHLQKYRLHTRKLQPENANPTAEKHPAVVLGGNLWNSQETLGECSKGSSSQSGSPQGPLQLAATTGGDSMEDDEDAKSESFSWKGHAQKPGKYEF